MIELVAPRALAIFSAALPVLRLPKPTGPFPVGTAILRPANAFAPELQLWYPARPAPECRTALYEPILPGKRNKIFRWLRTASMLDAPLADDGPLPVIVYVNGWNGTRWGNTALIQDLASHGFAVAAADQPAGMLDGFDLSAPMDFSTDEAHARTMRLIAVKLDVQLRTVGLVLDRLEELDTDPASRFSGHFDLTRTGIIGYSFGGATAAEAALSDPRLRASVNMDGLMYGAAAQTGPPFPHLKMNDGSLPVTDAERRSPDVAVRIRASMLDKAEQQTRTSFARNGGFSLTIPGTLHSNFSDYPILVPWRRFNGAGMIDPARAGEIIRHWAVHFFNFALLGGEWPDLNSEVVLESWPPPDRNPGRSGEAALASRFAAPR
jgi:dienelactone hydrolase